MNFDVVFSAVLVVGMLAAVTMESTSGLDSVFSLTYDKFDTKISYYNFLIMFNAHW